MGVRDECLGESRSALARYHRAVVFRLSDEERLTVRLAATLDGATWELVDLDAAVEVNPTDATLVTYENLVLGKLEVARQAVSTPSRPDVHVKAETHMMLLVRVPNDTTLFEDRACLPNLCIKGATEM